MNKHKRVHDNLYAEIPPHSVIPSVTQNFRDWRHGRIYEDLFYMTTNHRIHSAIENHILENLNS